MAASTPQSNVLQLLRFQQSKARQQGTRPRPLQRLATTRHCWAGTWAQLYWMCPLRLRMSPHGQGRFSALVSGLRQATCKTWVSGQVVRMGS